LVDLILPAAEASGMPKGKTVKKFCCPKNEISNRCCHFYPTTTKNYQAVMFSFFEMKISDVHLNLSSKLALESQL
jgi:hypothetical protein